MPSIAAGVELVALQQEFHLGNSAAGVVTDRRVIDGALEEEPPAIVGPAHRLADRSAGCRGGGAHFGVDRQVHTQLRTGAIDNDGRRAQVALHIAGHVDGAALDGVPPFPNLEREGPGGGAVGRLERTTIDAHFNPLNAIGVMGAAADNDRLTATGHPLNAPAIHQRIDGRSWRNGVNGQVETGVGLDHAAARVLLLQVEPHGGDGRIARGCGETVGIERAVDHPLHRVRIQPRVPHLKLIDHALEEAAIVGCRANG